MYKRNNDIKIDNSLSYTQNTQLYPYPKPENYILILSSIYAFVYKWSISLQLIN